MSYVLYTLQLSDLMLKLLGREDEDFLMAAASLRENNVKTKRDDKFCVAMAMYVCTFMHVHINRCAGTLL